VSRELAIIVDIANVMGARADGWWKDRAGAALRLCGEVAALAARGLAPGELPGDALPPAPPGAALARDFPQWVLVLEGQAREAARSLSMAPASCESAATLADSGGLARIVIAAGAGDDTIVHEAADLRERVMVVTADRELRRRCEHVGAVVAGPRWLLRLL
jgi:8-oxo-dGTP diphosphatase